MIDPYREKKWYILQRRLGTFSGHSLGKALCFRPLNSTRPTRSPEHICLLNLRCLNKPSPHWIFRLQLVYQLLRDRDAVILFMVDLPTGTSLFFHYGIYHYQKLSCLFVTYISLQPQQLLCQQNALSIANNKQMWVEGQIRGWISICIRNVFLSETPCRHVLVMVH